MRFGLFECVWGVVLTFGGRDITATLNRIIGVDW